MTTDKALAAIRLLAEKATPGPWDVDPREGDGRALVYRPATPGMIPIAANVAIARAPALLTAKQWQDNAAYIATVSPDVVLSLIERIEALEAENETLLEAVCDAQLVLDPNAETQWWRHYKHLTERTLSQETSDAE